MSSRTYLSIGDVLTLLREEFPDVTISKIRFLESQGLVNPERSPSGYRKFFDHDVERLRWVLRQQREHFLPLKVIRDRLADGELDETVGGADGGNGKPARAADAARPAAATAAPSATVEEQPTKADEEAMARILADASRRTAQRPDAVAPSAGRRGLQVVDEAPVPPVEAPRRHEPVPVGSACRADRVVASDGGYRVRGERAGGEWVGGGRAGRRRGRYVGCFPYQGRRTVEATGGAGPIEGVEPTGQRARARVKPRRRRGWPDPGATRPRARGRVWRAVPAPVPARVRNRECPW